MTKVTSQPNNKCKIIYFVKKTPTNLDTSPGIIP